MISGRQDQHWHTGIRYEITNVLTLFIWHDVMALFHIEMSMNKIYSRDLKMASVWFCSYD